MFLTTRSPAQQEWPNRWESFPRKLLVAYGKFHAMTLLMRVYEAVADRMYDDVTLDKLTIDTYSSTLRREKVGKQLTVRENFVECFWSNFIAYLADFSLHQIIITFGYLTYIREQRRRLSEARNNQEVDETKKDLHAGSMLISYTKKVRFECSIATDSQQEKPTQAILIFLVVISLLR